MKKGITVQLSINQVVSTMKTAVAFRMSTALNAGDNRFLTITPSYNSGSNWSNIDPSDPANTDQSEATCWPIAGTIKNLYIWWDTDNNPGESASITFFKNGVATPLTVTLGDGGAGIPVLTTDLVHSFNVVAGDLCSMNGIVSAGGSGGRFFIAYEFDPL